MVGLGKIISNLMGTLSAAFSIGKATLVSSNVLSKRYHQLQDRDGVLAHFDQLLRLETTGGQYETPLPIVGNCAKLSAFKPLQLSTSALNGDLRFAEFKLTDNFMEQVGLEPWYVEDFLTAAVTSANRPFTWAAISSGTFAQEASATSGIYSFGVLRISSSATANSGGVIAGGDITSCSMKWDTELICRFALISSTLGTTIIRIGFHDATTSTAPVDGVYLEIKTGGIYITFRKASADFSAQILVISNLPVAPTYYTVRLKMLSTVKVLVEILGQNNAKISVQVFTIPSGLIGDDTVRVRPSVIATDSGTTAKALVLVDLLAFKSGRVGRGSHICGDFENDTGF